MNPSGGADETLVMDDQGPETEPRLPSDRDFSLIILEGKTPGEEFRINKWTVIIGRDASVSDFVVEDPGASRSHACLEFDKDHFVIEDLESTNGLSVNDKPVTRAALNHADKITIGKTVIQYLVQNSGKKNRVYQIDEI